MKILLGLILILLNLTFVKAQSQAEFKSLETSKLIPSIIEGTFIIVKMTLINY